MGIGLRIVDDEQERLWSDYTAKRVQETVNEGGHRRKETVVGAGLPKWTWNGSAAVATACTVQLIGSLDRLTTFVTACVDKVAPPMLRLVH